MTSIGDVLTLDESTLPSKIKTPESVREALSGITSGEFLHLAGNDDGKGFTASAVLNKDQAKKYVGEITRVLRNGTLRVVLTDGRGCTCVPSTVKARQTSAPLRPGTRICMVGFRVQPTDRPGRNPERIFLNAFYVRKIH